MKFKIRLRPKFVVLISVIIGIVMISSAFFEMNQSRKEIYGVLNEQASSLIKTISLSSINTLNSSYEIENLISERLLDNAVMIKHLDSLNLLTRKKLIKIGNENNLYRINIFDNNGNRVLTNRVPEPGHTAPEGNVNRFEELRPILTGKTNMLIIGLHEARYSEGQRYAVAVSRAGRRGAIVINMDAKDFLTFRKKIGIGKIIGDIGNKSGIEYIVLQDSLGILAASAGISSINAISDDGFLLCALHSDSVYMRKFNFDGREVYEAVNRLKIDNDIIGLYRIGISLDEVRSAESRMHNRMILTTFILAAIAVIVLSIVFTSQNLKSVSKEYGKFKTFAASVLQNMAEAVIVTGNDFNIILFNNSAEKLFEIPAEKIIGKNLADLNDIRPDILIPRIISTDKRTFGLSINTYIKSKEKHLYIYISKNISSVDENENYTLVLNDYTERKKLEEQAERNGKLAAMGELASGVAHEIRNPINSIGMIAQRLIREFNPEEDKEEYKNITHLLKDEVSRVNKIISQFLNYARPLDLRRTATDPSEYFDAIYRLFLLQTREKGITLSITNNIKNDIYIDRELMKQALSNIVQNAVDAVHPGGSISIELHGEDNLIKIEIIDSGCGISQENIKKIFDLYFTTKKDGNGLGLSIAHKIIEQHNGSIEIESKINEGSKFIIKLPKV